MQVKSSQVIYFIIITSNLFHTNTLIRQTRDTCKCETPECKYLHHFVKHLTNVQASHRAVRFPDHMSDTFIHQRLQTLQDRSLKSLADKQREKKRESYLKFGSFWDCEEMSSPYQEVLFWQGWYEDWFNRLEKVETLSRPPACQTQAVSQCLFRIQRLHANAVTASVYWEGSSTEEPEVRSSLRIRRTWISKGASDKCANLMHPTACSRHDMSRAAVVLR